MVDIAGRLRPTWQRLVVWVAILGSSLIHGLLFPLLISLTPCWGSMNPCLPSMHHWHKQVPFIYSFRFHVQCTSHAAHFLSRHSVHGQYPVCRDIKRHHIPPSFCLFRCPTPSSGLLPIPVHPTGKCYSRSSPLWLYWPPLPQPRPSRARHSIMSLSSFSRTL